MSLYTPMARANMAMLAPLRTRLKILLDRHDISDAQYTQIVTVLVTNDEILDVSMKDHDDHATRPTLSNELVLIFLEWINEELTGNRLVQDTADLIINLFTLYLPPGIEAVNTSSTPNGAASASYTSNGVVQFLANSNFAPSSGIYNGIWGYEIGVREYALQCNAAGLNILDVTDTNNIVKVQTIPMPGGNPWRDVATYSHYAYVAAQAGGNAWVIDLEQLSSSTPQGTDDNPITEDYIKDIGYLNLGHTVNVDKGLLFLNSAGGSAGCKILDLQSDPMSPSVLVDKTETYGGRDCHDSYVQTIGNSDILVSSDGYYKNWRIFDITNIRTSNPPISYLGVTPLLTTRVYAHQSVMSEDGNTLFVFEEFNDFDIGIYNIQNLASPTLIRKFQWSDDGTMNAIVHNGYVRGDQLIVAYYEAGLRVFDISNVNSGITEVGKLETYRDPDGDGVFNNQIQSKYNGAWNVYVGSTSGKVLISDTISGTFVVTINPNPLPPSAPTLSPTQAPTLSPTQVPSVSPTSPPTVSPTQAPTLSPTSPPDVFPTLTPTVSPTQAPTVSPTSPPEVSPTSTPTMPPTSTPAVSPTLAPIVTCTQLSNTRFLFKIKKSQGGVTKYMGKSCNWLTKQSLKKAENICKKKIRCNGQFGVVWNVCPQTCDSCLSCDQNPKALFYLRTKKKKNKDIIKRCKWLGKQSPKDIETICQTEQSPSCYGTAKEICPKTCSVVTSCGQFVENNDSKIFK